MNAASRLRLLGVLNIDTMNKLINKSLYPNCHWVKKILKLQDCKKPSAAEIAKLNRFLSLLPRMPFAPNLTTRELISDALQFGELIYVSKKCVLS